MNPLDSFSQHAGRWLGSNRLHDPNTGGPEDSPATLRLTPLLGGRFLRTDYTWVYQGKPQEGSVLWGADPKAGTQSAYFIDSWHMGRLGMTCQGAVAADGALDVRGTYAAPPGPDWGWRLRLEATGADGLLFRMWNIWPEGKEEIAVEATYRRAGVE